MEDDFRTVKLILRNAEGDERAWSVEVDSRAPLESLLADLVKELKLEGGTANYELHNEGSLAEPVLVIKRKERSNIRNIKQYP